MSNKNTLIRILAKFNTILDNGQKKRIALLIAMMLLGAIMETLSVSIVVPIVTVVMDSSYFAENRFVAGFAKAIGIKNSSGLIVFLLISMIGIFVVKGLYLLLETYIQQRFICNNRSRVQTKMLENILNQEYIYFLNQATGNIMRTVINDVERAYALLSRVLEFFTQAIICLILGITVVMVDAQIALCLGLILIVELILINWLCKRRMRFYGSNIKKLKGEQNKWVMQAVSGIKEAKIAQNEKFFEKQFGQLVKKGAMYEKRYSVLNVVPRQMIEAMTISAMLVYMIVLVNRGREIATIIPQLSAFVVAAVKLLPAVTKVMTCYNDFSFYEANLDEMIASFDAMEDEISIISKKEHSENEHWELKKNVFGFSSLDYSYPNSERMVLSGANIEIPMEKSVGIIGASGEGKTTVVDLMLGLLKPISGIVYADGQDIQKDYSNWLHRVAYIPQSIFLLDASIRDNIIFGAPDTDDTKLVKALEEAQLKTFVDGLEEGINTQIGERGVRLSGGQRQRIGIARALYNNPEILFFDEATSALDNETETAIMESINSLHGKKTIVIIAHRLSTIEDCDLVYRVKDSKILLENSV